MQVAVIQPEHTHTHAHNYNIMCLLSTKINNNCGHTLTDGSESDDESVDNLFT